MNSLYCKFTKLRNLVTEICLFSGHVTPSVRPKQRDVRTPESSNKFWKQVLGAVLEQVQDQQDAGEGKWTLNEVKYKQTKIILHKYFSEPNLTDCKLQFKYFDLFQ